MNIHVSRLLTMVIRPTLAVLGVESTTAERLLLGTAAQASDFDPLVSGTGSSTDKRYGIYQITSQQHRNVWDTYLAFRPDLASTVRGLASQHQFLKNPDEELVTNLAYSTAIAWIIYQQAELVLPEEDDLEGLGKCWESNFCKSDSANTTHFTQWVKEHAAA